MQFSELCKIFRLEVRCGEKHVRDAVNEFGRIVSRGVTMMLWTKAAMLISALGSGVSKLGAVLGPVGLVAVVGMGCITTTACYAKEFWQAVIAECLITVIAIMVIWLYQVRKSPVQLSPLTDARPIRRDKLPVCVVKK